MERTTLSVQLLGPMRLTIGDHEVVAPWPRPAARRLVVLLVLADRHVLARDVLTERLFPHLDASRAARSLSKALSLARSVVDPPSTPSSLIVADRATIGLVEQVDVEVDLTAHLAELRAAERATEPLERARRLRRSLRDLATPLLEDRDQPWATDLGREVERARREARLALARTTDRLTDRQAAFDADPTDEEVCSVLVDGYLNEGRAAEAVRTVIAHREALERLGLRADPALVATLTDHTDEPGPDAAGTGGDTGASGASPWPLFGRERELTAALSTLRPTDGGRAGDVLVAAGAGMGKSHLLAAVRDTLSREGFLVPAATAVPDDRLVPFASLRAALSRLPFVPTSPLVARLLVPAEAASLGRRPVPAELAATTSALRGQLDHLARDRPLVLCLDDVHWADGAQQALLHRLCSEPVPRRWSLLLAARTDELTAPPPELPSRVTRLPLRRLPPTATRRLAELAASSVGDDDPASHERIASRGRGHPFFTVELARMLGSPSNDDQQPPAALDLLTPPVPDRIVELLRRRLAACSPAARRLTACIAVAGDDARLDLLEHVAETLRIDDLGATVLELQRANLARASGPAMELEHPLLREAALSTLDPMRRADVHEAVADALAATASSRADQQLRVARHRVAAFTVAPGEAHAAGALVSGVAGAAVAHELGAEAVALALYEGAAAAFEALPTQRRAAFRSTAFRGRLSLAELRCASGAYRSAEETFGSALVLARTATDHAHVWRGTSQVAYLQGDLPEAVARLEAGLARLAPEATVARATLVLEVGWCRWRQGDGAALEMLHGAVELAVRGDDLLVLTRALDRYGLVLTDHGRIPESLDAFERALSAARRCGDPQEEAVTHLHHVRPLIAAGRHDEAVAELGRAIALSERHGLLYVRSVAHWFAAEVAVAAGDHEGALAQRDGELALLTDLGNDLNLEACQRHRAELLRLLGREDDAAAAQREAEAAGVRLHASPAGGARSGGGRRS